MDILICFTNLQQLYNFTLIIPNSYSTYSIKFVIKLIWGIFDFGSKQCVRWSMNNLIHPAHYWASPNPRVILFRETRFHLWRNWHVANLRYQEPAVWLVASVRTVPDLAASFISRSLIYLKDKLTWFFQEFFAPVVIHTMCTLQERCEWHVMIDHIYKIKSTERRKGGKHTEELLKNLRIMFIWIKSSLFNVYPWWK